MSLSVQTELFGRMEHNLKVPRSNGLANKLDDSDKMFHDWYRFVLSFPPHLVRDYFDKFRLRNGQTILDPFCGTGTTIVEAKLNRINSIGVEPNPMAHFASCVKSQWDLDPEEFIKHADYISERTKKIINNNHSDHLRTLPLESEVLLLTDSISPLPLHKAIILLEQINNEKDSPFYNHEILAFAKSLVFTVSNLHFGPEVGVHRNKKSDAPVVESWLSEVNTMARDICRAEHNSTSSIVHKADSRQLSNILEPKSIDAVFTSPPYPNEKDYSRTTRLESVLLGFINNKKELQSLKRTLLRSNTRNVYKGDDDDTWIAQHSEIQRIADAIEKKRIELGKTSGFEKLYGKVTKLYFGGMARHLAELRTLLKPGAYLGYVVGDQASYLQILIKTGELLADIAKSLGYEVVSLDLFRTRLATVTKKQLREEVVVLRWLS
jgi:16S rRNA G966 N2-methylase RsmD